MEHTGLARILWWIQKPKTTGTCCHCLFVHFFHKNTVHHTTVFCQGRSSRLRVTCAGVMSTVACNNSQYCSTVNVYNSSPDTPSVMVMCRNAILSMPVVAETSRTNGIITILYFYSSVICSVTYFTSFQSFFSAVSFCFKSFLSSPL